jgi:hypothetical protein
MALNRDPELRQWAEQWLKSKERSIAGDMTDEEFDKHWLRSSGENARGRSRSPHGVSTRAPRVGRERKDE